MFKTRGGAGGQRPFEQCSKKHPKWSPGASLRGYLVLLEGMFVHMERASRKMRVPGRETVPKRFNEFILISNMSHKPHDSISII